MCGIGGIICRDQATKGINSQIQTMSLLLRHRGPDGEGFLSIDAKNLTASPLAGKETPPAILESNIRQKPGARLEESDSGKMGFLFHRQLKILDLSHESHQPMCSPDQKLWIIHNGEIYNYQSIRAELMTFGHTFESDTDTEVILHAYRQWGKSCVDRFNGMWSFVIYDAEKAELFGCRDRSGVKPFYYFLNNTYFAFASEAKALIRMPFIPNEVNSNKAFDLLVLNDFTTHDETLFKGINELKPSHYFTFNLKNWDWRQQSYFSFQTTDFIHPFSQKKAAHFTEQTSSLLNDAIRIRLQAKVPIGTCLSGGLDSSTIACTINQLSDEQILPQLGSKQSLFTAGFPQSAFNEDQWAKLIAGSTKSEWFQVTPTSEEFLSDLETLHYCQDFPIASASTYAQFRVMRTAKEAGMRVLINGQGADELFAGYPHQADIYRLQMLRLWRLAACLRETRHDFGLNFNRMIRHWTKNKAFAKLNTSSAQRILKGRFEDWNYINPDLIVENKDRFEAIFNQYEQHLNAQLLKDFTGGYLQYLLKSEDRSAMWHSIETRTPFADDLPLTQFAFSIPANYKIRNGQSKYILREAVKGIIPEAIRQRKDKMGFVAPTNIWIDELRQELKAYFTPALSPWLNVSKLDERYDIFFHVSRKAENRRVFKLISFAIWHKVFFGQGIRN